MSNRENFVSDFMDMVKSLGGEYIPFRDFEKSTNKHTSGRRESRPWARNVVEVSEVKAQRAQQAVQVAFSTNDLDLMVRLHKEFGEKYYRTDRGYLRKVFPKGA